MGLNGVETDPGDSSYVEGTWQSFCHQNPNAPAGCCCRNIYVAESDATGTVGGSGTAQPTGGITRGAAQAVSDITLNAGPGSADVFIAQAVFTGPVYCLILPGTLSIYGSIFAPLTLTQCLPGNLPTAKSVWVLSYLTLILLTPLPDSLYPCLRHKIVCQLD